MVAAARASIPNLTLPPLHSPVFFCSACSKRKRCQSRLGAKHRITAEETKKWFIKKFDGVLNHGKPINVSNFRGKKGKKK